MTIKPLIHVATTLAFLCASAPFQSQNVSAQVIDFSKIDTFESMGTGTQRGASPPKTIIDDAEWHTIFITILESDTEAKVYWRSTEGDQTTIIQGPGVQAFQTAGEFKLQALGDANHSVKYGYVLFRLRHNQ